MITPEKLKETLDKSSGMIPEMLKTTTSKNEEIAALNAVQILYNDMDGVPVDFQSGINQLPDEIRLHLCFPKYACCCSLAQ